ncbi:hypothetical protein M378DRAFT_134141 [Amanita muscaria Koide BX008]|uniref:Uncharacterized protein n=1 Tax=Amanita muscaria (strain Koide BX008) TaxID=946122 RepID=A0A0C2SP13_AMAMK|nr:hypothetical protein M378DRAFT_134141 [Amanita muscaria Koide BX008]
MIDHQPYPYIGTEKLLVIGIDVGTTLSGVSYALLEPGKVPRIRPVTRFSGQREENGKSKICSVVCYDKDGNVIAVGPETDPEVNPMLSEIDDVRQAEWSVCEINVNHFFYSVERQHSNKRKIPRPVMDEFKAPDQVFTDFLQYLFKSAKEYIIETERNLDPTFSWASIEKNFVLTHPNEWGKRQQSQMRDVAVAAGLVSRATATDRITFVTEGEASLHFCLNKNPELRQEQNGILVVDCGGGTIDLSAYSQTGKGRYQQIVSPYCLRQGSISVTSRARDYFKGKFKDSQFGSDGDIETMARAFDKPEGVKCIFRYPNRPYFVNFGGLRDNDRKYGVSGGKFKVEGPQMAKFFDPAIQDIISGIENQCRHTRDGISIKYALIVGGFGRSQYLYQKLCDYCDSNGIVILRPDIAHLNKAVADGAVSWYLDRNVSSHSYDVMTRHLLDPTDPDHLNRESAAWTTVNTAGNRGQTACVKQAFTLRRTKPSPPQIHACNNGQKLPGTTGAANRRREKPATVGSSSQARRNWQERRDTGEIGTGSQDSDFRSRNGRFERLKAEEVNHYRGRRYEVSEF